MFRLDRRYLIVLGVLSVLALVPLTPPSSSSIEAQLDPRFEQVPFASGDWAGKDIPVDDLTYQILETKNVLSRLYENQNGEVIHLLLVSSAKDRRVAHPPEVCYISSHYDVVHSKESVFRIDGSPVPVKLFVAQDQLDPQHREQVLYLYQVGKRLTTNYYAQQLRFALDRVSRRESRVLLIRLSGPSDQNFQEFLSEILRHLQI